MAIFVTRQFFTSQPTVFVETQNAKNTCFEAFISWTKRFTQQTAQKAISKRYERKLKNNDCKGIF